MGDHPSIRALPNAAVGGPAGAKRRARGLLGGNSDTRSHTCALTHRDAVPDGHASAFAHRGSNRDTGARSATSAGFSLSTGTGERHSLDDLLAGRDALVVIFYRSYG